MTVGAVLVFGWRPELGLVKTRLAPWIGKPATLALYRAFLVDTLHAVRQSGATVLLAHTSGPYFPEQDLADIKFEQRAATPLGNVSTPPWWMLRINCQTRCRWSSSALIHRTYPRNFSERLSTP